MNRPRIAKLISAIGTSAIMLVIIVRLMLNDSIWSIPGDDSATAIIRFKNCAQAAIFSSFTLYVVSRFVLSFFGPRSELDISATSAIRKETKKWFLISAGAAAATVILMWLAVLQPGWNADVATDDQRVMVQLFLFPSIAAGIFSFYGMYRAFGKRH